MFFCKKEKKWLEIHKKEDSKDYYTWINRRIDEVEKKKKQAEEEKSSETEKNPVKIWLINLFS